ncbi:hypothetical protein [Azospirillum sp. 11R-A]|uniref:hypothetical protein n=1 Tax=Azospirillum sp. 11R-A TaxID=3111634 RepID=UPI003C2B5ABB
MIFLFRKPEDRKEENSATVEYLDDDGVVTKTVWQRVEGVLDDIILENAATAEREAISLSRQDLLNALKWTGHSVSYRENADAFTALAAQPLAFYKPLSRSHHIDVLRLRRADLAAWFDGSGLPWPRPAWLPLPIALPAVALPDPTPTRAAFPDRKVNLLRDVAKRWAKMSGEQESLFLKDAITGIRSGELAVMARSGSGDRRIRGMLLPMPLETIEFMTFGWLDEDERTKEFACGLLVTREALAAWYRPGVPETPGPALNELWPAPDAPKEGPKETAPENAPVAAPDAALEEAPSAEMTAQEGPAPGATLEEVPAAEGEPAPDAGSAALQCDGDEQFTPPKLRGPGRPPGGAHDNAVLDEFRRWPAGQEMNISEIAGRTRATRPRVRLLLERWTASQAERDAE